MATSTDVQRIGVKRDEQTGELVIPASRRADGSLRKVRRVKEGYVPQEEVPVYESRGAQWLKSVPTLPPGLHIDEHYEIVRRQDEEHRASPETREVPQSMASMSKAAKKNMKRKEKKKQLKDGENEEKSGLCDKVEALAVNNNGNITTKKGVNSGEIADKAKEAFIAEDSLSNDRRKRLRNLQKKLKQVNDLRSKIELGEIERPTKEQQEKVAKQAEVESEIEDLKVELGEDS